MAPELRPEKPLTCCILAGGFGTRLGDWGKSSPKALVEVFGKPILAHQIDALHREGFSKIVICTHFKHEMIAEYVSKTFPLHNIVLSREATALGTGGAVKNAAPHLEGQFLILNGDTLHEESYREIFTYFSSRIGIGGGAGMLIGKDIPKIMGEYNVYVRNNVIESLGSKEKSNFTDFGVYFSDSTMFLKYPSSQFSILEFLNSWLHQKKLSPKLSQKSFLDLGTAERINYAERNRFG